MASVIDVSGMDEEELQLLYTYIDNIPLSRPKKNIARDFSDAVLMAEVVKYYYPRLVQMHNYIAANSVKKKMYNWNTLNQKVFKKMQFSVPKDEIEQIVKCVPGAIERLLRRFQIKITQLQEQGFDPTVVVGREQIARLTEAGIGGGSGGIRLRPGARHQSPSALLRGGRDPDTDDQFDDMLNDIVADHSFNRRADGRNERMRQNAVPPEDADKDAKIAELRDTVDLLEQKINKLTMLVRLKDSKIVTLTSKLKEAGLLR